jgi:hypothetical protein
MILKIDDVISPSEYWSCKGRISHCLTINWGHIVLLAWCSISSLSETDICFMRACFGCRFCIARWILIGFPCVFEVVDFYCLFSLISDITWCFYFDT